MRMKLLFATAFSLAILSSVAFANANIARQPKVLRQTYSDGSFTEIECNWVPDPKRPTCEFRVGDKGRIKAYSLRLSDYGYRSFFVMAGYSYWPNGGQFPPQVRIEVSCLDLDLALIAGANEDNAECHLELSAIGKRLVAIRVHISAFINGEYVPAHRAIDDGGK